MHGFEIARIPRIISLTRMPNYTCKRLQPMVATCVHK